MTKADIRAHFGFAENEPLPDFSVFPLRKVAELSRYVTPVGSLVDAYPVHVITRGSLAAMAARSLRDPTSMFAGSGPSSSSHRAGRRVARE